MRQVKSIAIAVICTIMFFVAFDFVGGLICDKLKESAKSGLYAKQRYIFDEATEDVIIIGSSRAQHHYIPQIIEDSLGLSGYNAGCDGQSVFYQYVTVSNIIARDHKPKLILYEVTDLDVIKNKNDMFSLSATLQNLSPQYGRYPAVDELFDLEGWKEKALMNLRLYRWNSNMGNLLSSLAKVSDNNKGYIPIKGVMETIPKEYSNDDDNELDNQNIKYFKKLYKLTKDNEIELILAISPKLTPMSLIGISWIEKFAAENSIAFFNMQRINDLMYPTFFKDDNHLNDKGAKAYTSRIITLIKHREQ